MASPVAIHASSHPNSHFFKGPPSYTDGFDTRRLRESAMGQYRAHPYEGRISSRSPPRPVRDYHSFDASNTDTSPSQQQSARSPSLQHQTLHSHHTVPSQLADPSSRPQIISNNSKRMPVGQLLDGHQASSSHVTVTYSPEARSSQQVQAPTNNMSPPRAAEQDSRLPGINSLLSMTADSHTHEREQRFAPPALTTSFQPQRYHHSAASSLSSAISEPVSPNSYSGGYHSRSPIQPPHISIDGRARANSHLPYYVRDEPQAQASHYDHPRAHTLPSLPRHGANYSHSDQSVNGPYASLRESPHSQSMLPPPQESYTPYGQYSSQRPMYPYAASHHPSQATQHSWDRPRIDSAMPPGFDPQMASASPYGWPYSHQAHASMARKRRGNLPKEATKILKDWFGRHHDSPYPSEDEKQELCRRTSLQISQVNNWFINARRRLPRDDARKQVEMEGQQRSTTVDSLESAGESSAGRAI